MEAKKFREAIKYNKDFIEHLKDQIECSQKKDGNRILIATYQEQIARCEVIAEALEKQLPMKPNLEGDGYAPDGSFLYDMWECPKCGTHYEVDYDDYDYCPNCGQHIDLTE